MAMKISRTSGGSVHGAGGGGQVGASQGQTRTSSAGASGSASNSDKVSLTSSASQLQQLEEHIASLPVEDAQRIAETKQALASGNYEVDAPSAANGLLEVERGFAKAE